MSPTCHEIYIITHFAAMSVRNYTLKHSRLAGDGRPRHDLVGRNVRKN